MAAIKFSERNVHKFAPPSPASKSACAEYRDAKVSGLVVSVTKTGKRTFVFRSTFRGKKIFIHIGNVEDISLEEAREIARGYRAAIDQGMDPHAPRQKRDKTPFFAEFCVMYMEWAREYKRSYDDDQSKIDNHLLEEFGQFLLSDISTQMIHLYLGSKSKRLSKSTLNRHLSLLSRMFRLAMQWNLTDTNPCSGIEKFREPVGKTEFLTIEEAKKLIKALEGCPYHTSALAILALLYTGLRLEEVLQARQENLDFTNRVLHLPMTKSGRSRNVVLNDRACAVLAKAAERSGSSEWVFAGSDASKPIRNIRKTFHYVLKQAGLPVMRLHSLRHNYASLLVQQGVSLVQVQMLLNHASPQTTLRYAHLADHTLRDATQVFADQFAD